MTEQSPPPDAAPDDTPWWVASVLGLWLTGFGVFVLYETLGRYSQTLAAWGTCLQAEGGAVFNCNSELTLSLPYRYGIGLLPAMALAFVVVLAGPIPLIATLNRYRHNVIAGILFFIVMIPYGTVAFLLVVMGLLAVAFSLLQVSN